MLSVEEATELVLAHAGRQPIEAVPLDAAGGLVLAEAVHSDLDSPPFDKSLVDGFAVRNADLAGGRAELELIGELPAGAVADRPVEPGTTWQVMTGAPIPAGAEAVVMVERSRSGRPGTVLLEDPSFRPGQHVLTRGREMTAGQLVIEPGQVLGPAELGLLATVGHTSPKVHRRPRVAVLSTGDEIVPADQVPGPSQIRNSNETMLVALARQAGADVTRVGIARDQLEDLRNKVTQGLSADVLILTGGVSAGRRDFVPGVLAACGVEPIFHKVSLKPGKPVFFGRHAGGLVFGLPGNPVSAFCCFVLFVRTALRARQGWPSPRPVEWRAELACDFHHPTDRTTFHPARLTSGSRGLLVEPVAWFGSPDLRGLAAADALLVLPPTSHPHAAGSILPVLRLDRP